MKKPTLMRRPGTPVRIVAISAMTVDSKGDEEDVCAEDGEDDAGDHACPGQEGCQPLHRLKRVSASRALKCRTV